MLYISICYLPYIKASDALGTLGFNDEEIGFNAFYACALDNCGITPEMCRKMTRVGTVFYQLDWNEEPVTIRKRCYRFQPWWYVDELKEEDRLVMARFTPNFDKELWKYHALDMLGAEFHWKKISKNCGRLFLNNN